MHLCLTCISKDAPFLILLIFFVFFVFFAFFLFFAFYLFRGCIMCEMVFIAAT